jgi:TPR repeat protein
MSVDYGSGINRYQCDRNGTKVGTGMQYFISMVCAFWAFAAVAQVDSNPEIPPDTPVDQMVCEAIAQVDSCWTLGVRYLESDPGLAVQIMEKSCAFGLPHENYIGCYQAAKIYLLDKRYVNYDRAYTLFQDICFDDPDVGSGPWGCKYLGYMVQMGLGRPADVKAAHDLFMRACFTNSDYFSDAEGCEFLARSYYAGFDWDMPGRSPNGMYLAFVSYARGCLVRGSGVALCEEGARFLTANRHNADLVAALKQCNRAHHSMVQDQWTCEDLFARRNSPAFEGDQAAGPDFMANYVAFWSAEFAYSASQ